jgi:hypothetical protein
LHPEEEEEDEEELEELEELEESEDDDGKDEDREEDDEDDESGIRSVLLPSGEFEVLIARYWGCPILKLMPFSVRGHATELWKFERTRRREVAIQFGSAASSTTRKPMKWERTCGML